MAMLKETNDLEDKTKSVNNIVFLLYLKCYKGTNYTIYLCSRHVPRFAVSGGQDLSEEHFGFLVWIN